MSGFHDPGHVFTGRYAIERELGRGGMATVYLATDLRHHRPVALKILSPDVAARIGPDRFFREILIVANLAHPHIIPLHDSGELEGFIFFVMPYVEGETLGQLVNRQGRLSVDEALRITREVADAVGYAHSRGIIHRDIKPSNVLLHAGHAVVADFGIARALQESTVDRITTPGFVFGTPGYMSPEQIAGEQLDGRTDIYSLGCIVFEMLTGITPNAAAKGKDAIPALRTLRPDAPLAVEHAVARALAPKREDRFENVADFVVALTQPDHRKPIWARREFRAPAAMVTALVAIVALAIGSTRFCWTPSSCRAAPRPDMNMITVAPFYVASSDPTLRAWKDHLALIVQQKLDGAGPLRAVSPSVASYDSPGVTDRASARALGERTQAGLVTFGTLLQTGPHAFRVDAEILDVRRNTVVEEVQASVSDSALDADALLAQLSDSLTHQLLTRLESRTRVTAVGRGAFGCARTAWPAVRAYLRGEEFYRRTMFDSANAAYMRAIATDSTCALAYHRVAVGRGWVDPDDPLVLEYKLKAGAHNHGLAPRDSLLVVGDSITAAMLGESPSALYWRLAARLFATLEDATRRYPGDSEVWHALADARFHYGWGPERTTPHEVLAAFDTAIALDSGFAPSYIHAIELGFALGGDSLAMRHAHAFLSTNPVGVNADGVRLVVRLLESQKSRSETTIRRALDSASTDAVIWARLLFDRRRDSLETAVSLSHLSVYRGDVDSSVAPGHCQAPRPLLARRLAYRGHLRDALCALGDRTESRLFAELVFLNGVPPDSATHELDRWLASRSRFLAFAIPWWWEHGDTARIKRVIDGARSVLRTKATGVAREHAVYDSASAAGYLALARHDSSALDRFVHLPDTLCLGCFDFDRLKTVQLLAKAGRLSDARRIAEEWRGSSVAPSDVLYALELGRVAEQLGDRDAALVAYRSVVETWVNPDPVLQPAVSEARDGIRRLTGERERGVRVAR